MVLNHVINLADYHSTDVRFFNRLMVNTKRNWTINNVARIIQIIEDE